ncbi:MAG: protein kinase [Bryobacteraceae bacterium]
MLNQLGKYRLEHELGRGAFGHVYQAFDPTLRRRVAIKVLPPHAPPDALNRLRIEAEAAGKLNHKNIVRVHEFPDDHSTPYLVMELVEGRTLESIIRNNESIPLLERIEILYQVAEGLSYAHQKELIHRDIKPANIMVTSDRVAKILDFGIARETDPTGKEGTQSGQTPGTSAYMAPELFRGATADVKTDIFSYGLVFYEFLSGVHPFPMGDSGIVAHQVNSHDPRPLGLLVRDCPGALDSLVKRLIETNPNMRCDSVDDALVELRPILTELKERRAAELYAEVSLAVTSGDLRNVQDRLKQVLELDGQHAEARKLREHLKRQERDRVLNERLQELKARGKIHLAEQRFSDAIAVFEKCLEYADSDPETLELRNRAKALLERNRKITRLLAEAKWEEQACNLQNALAKASEAASLDEGLQEARLLRDRLQQQIRRLEADAILGRAENAFTQRNYEAALELLNAINPDPDFASKVEELRSKIQEAKEEQRRIERAVQFQDRFAIAELTLAEQRMEDAERFAETLCREYPEQILAGELYGRVIATRVRIATVTSAAQAVDQLIESKEFKKADQVLEGILEIYPEAQELIDLRQKVHLELVRHERELAIREVAEKASSLLQDGYLDDAANTISAALSKFGPNEVLNDCQFKVHAEMERKIHEIWLKRTVADAENAISDGHPAKALELLRRANVQHPEEDRFKSLIRAAEEAQIAIDYREFIASALERVRQCESQRNFVEALEVVQEALNRAPDDLQLHRACERLRRKLLEEENREHSFRTTVGQLEFAIRSEDWDAAAIRLEEARQLCSEPAILEAFATLIAQGRRKRDLAQTETAIRSALDKGDLVEAEWQLAVRKPTLPGEMWQSLEAELKSHRLRAIAISLAEEALTNQEFQRAKALLSCMPELRTDPRACSLLLAVEQEERQQINELSTEVRNGFEPERKSEPEEIRPERSLAVGSESVVEDVSPHVPTYPFVAAIGGHGIFQHARMRATIAVLTLLIVALGLFLFVRIPKTPKPVSEVQKKAEAAETTHYPDAKPIQAQTIPDGTLPHEAKESLEVSEWRSLNRSDSHALQAYLDRYPGGVYSGKAESLLKRARAEADQGQIVECIAAYASAIRRKDEGQLKRVWPTIPDSDLRYWHETFQKARSISLQLQPLGNPAIAGSSARVICRRTVEKVYMDGRPTYSDSAAISISLRRRPSGWSIAAVSAP